jgi:hypothetical protein
MCDWIDNALVFVLRSSSLIYGVMRMEVDVHSYLLQIVNDELQMGLKHL